MDGNANSPTTNASTVVDLSTQFNYISCKIVMNLPVIIMLMRGIGNGKENPNPNLWGDVVVLEGCILGKGYRSPPR